MRELHAASWQVSLLQEPEKPQKSQRNCAFPRGVALTQEERDSHVHGGKWERGKERDTCKRRLEVSEMDKWVSTVPVSAWWPKFYPCIPGAYAERREPIHKCVLCPLHANCGKHTACAHAHTRTHTAKREKQRNVNGQGQWGNKKDPVSTVFTASRISVRRITLFDSKVWVLKCHPLLQTPCTFRRVSTV